MNTRFFCMVLVCLSCFGCAPRPEVTAPQGESRAAMIPSAPEGMRLGAPYLSALNEQCFEAYPADAPSSQPQAMCARDGGWTLLPAIYLSLPTHGVPVASPDTGMQ